MRPDRKQRFVHSTGTIKKKNIPMGKLLFNKCGKNNSNIIGIQLT